MIYIISTSELQLNIRLDQSNIRLTCIELKNMSHFLDLDVAFYMHLTLYSFIYYNSQRFPITVNVHVKD